MYNQKGVLDQKSLKEIHVHRVFYFYLNTTARYALQN